MQGSPIKRYINVYLCLGSNLGDRKGNIEAASKLIDQLIGKIAKKSRFYETQPWGKPDQDWFYNQMLMINTTQDPREMLENITKIERQVGREKGEKWGPRIIDVDIIFYGKRVIRDKGLEIPHPEMHKRGFVLVPMLELAPELEHPVLHKTMDELFLNLDDLSEVVML